MTFEVLDPTELMGGPPFRQDIFLTNVNNLNWDRYEKKHVLVRGCASALIPPWAYMCIAARLAPLARSVRYGNEHDNIVVPRNPELP